MPRFDSGRDRWSRRRLLGVAAGSAALAPALLLGCGGPALSPGPTGAAATAGPVRRGGRLQIAFPDSPKQLDPAIMTLNEEYNVTLAVYNNLVRIDPQLQPQPELATSWQA